MVGRLDKRAAEERDQSGFVAVDAESDKRGSHLRRGWYWGKQAFAESLLKVGEAAIGRNREARGYDASPAMKCSWRATSAGSAGGGVAGGKTRQGRVDWAGLH